MARRNQTRRVVGVLWLWSALGTACAVQEPVENYVTRTTWEQEVRYVALSPTPLASALVVAPPEIQDRFSADLTWGHDFVGVERPVSEGVLPTGPRVALRMPLGDRVELTFQGGWANARSSHSLSPGVGRALLPNTAMGLRHALELKGGRTISVAIHHGLTMVASVASASGTRTDHWYYGEEDVYPTGSTARFLGVTMLAGGAVWMTDHRRSRRALDFGAMIGTAADEPRARERTGVCTYDSPTAEASCRGVRHARQAVPFHYPHTAVGTPFVAVWRRADEASLGVRVFGPTVTSSREVLSWGRVELTAQLAKH